MPNAASTVAYRPTLDPVKGRRRYLTIMFADLCNSTGIAEAMDAEDYAELIAELCATYEVVVSRHGGTLVRIDGDGIIVLFGHPRSRDDDGRRATETALELRTAVRNQARRWPAIERGLDVHCGIHSGLVMLHTGDIVRGAFEILGDATNVAARLSDAATRGEIIVSETTLGADRCYFATGERRLLRLAGLSRPLAAYTITGHAGVDTRYAARTRRGLVPFVGRERELDHLDARLAECADDGPALVLVRGPTGIGKTRMVEEFIARAADKGVAILRGCCEAYFSAEPLQPFLQMLRSALDLPPDTPSAEAASRVDAALARLGPQLAAHGPALGAILGTGQREAGQPAGDRKFDLVPAVCALLAAYAGAAPLILFIDDWQAADDASRLLLDAIIGAAPGRMLIVLTARDIRPEDLQLGGGEMIELGPLSDSESAVAILSLVPLLDPFAMAGVQAAAGGNALILEELCHSIASGDGRAEHPLGSGWLEVLIESRFARLSEDHAALVRCAAVIGNVVPLWLLHTICPHEDIDPLLTGLAGEDFLFRDERPGVVRFKHGVTRETIYQTIRRAERRELHLAVATALRERAGTGEDELYEALAYHYGAADRPGEAARFAELAGDKAMAAGSLDRAQAQYLVAIDALDRLDPPEAAAERRAGLFKRYFQACVFDPSPDQIAVFERAAEHCRERNELRDAACLQHFTGCLHYALGDIRRASAVCEEAIAAAEALADTALATNARATLGQAYQAATDYVRALPLLDHAIAVKRALPGRTSANLAYALVCKGMALADIGDFADADACFDEAIAMVVDANHWVASSVLAARSAACLWQGRYREAEHHASESERLALSLRSRYNLAMARALHVYAQWQQSRDAALVQPLVDATRWLEAGGRRQFVSLNHGWLAQLLLDSGRIAEARRHAASALRRARIGDRLGESATYRALAWGAARAQDRQGALAYLDRALRAAQGRASRREIATTRLCQAEIALAAGETVRALGLLDQAGQAFAAMAMLPHLAETERLLRAARARTQATPAAPPEGR